MKKIEVDSTFKVAPTRTKMLEPVDQQYYKIGYIARSHGVEGTILIIPEIYAPALFDDIDLVRVQDARGDLISARIESVRVQEKNNRLSFFVKFDHITDRNQAEALKNYSVFVARNKIDHLIEEEETGPLTSFEIQNEAGEKVGIVDHVIDNPAHPVLAVQNEQEQLLIPCVDEYIVNIDEENAVIHCQNLDQLADL